MSDAKDTARVEMFSDGVFAIAITLLILELKVPRGLSAADLRHALIEEWPSYAAYFLSFATIGINWISHHWLFTLVRRVSGATCPRRRAGLRYSGSAMALCGAMALFFARPPRFTSRTSGLP